MNISRQINILCMDTEIGIDGVVNLVSAINEWSANTQKELFEQLSQLEKKHDEAEENLENTRESISDKICIVNETKRTMYASVSVSLYAVIENFLRELFVIMGIKIPGKSLYDLIKNFLRDLYNIMNIKIFGKRGNMIEYPNWRHFRKSIRKSSNIQFNKIPSFENVNRVRLLNNCFKHSSGTVNSELAKNLHLNQGDVIKYESEDWDSLIKDCKSFMSSLAEKMQNYHDMVHTKVL